MGLVGAAAAFVASRPLTDNSFLTHLATGRLILADGVPAENPFLFTGTSFPVPSWWWSVLLAGRRGGLRAAPGSDCSPLRWRSSWAPCWSV